MAPRNGGRRPGQNLRRSQGPVGRRGRAEAGSPFRPEKAATCCRLYESGGAGGIRTLDTVLPYTHFPGERLRPLDHLSLMFIPKSLKEFL